MTDRVSVRVNIADFRRDLQALGRKVESRIVTRGLRAAGAVFRDSARGIAPRRTGALQRSLYVTRSRQSRPGLIVFSVGVRGRRTGKKGRVTDAFYWRFLEGGWIPRGPGRRIAGGRRRRNLERSRLAGQRIELPFLRPAFQRNQTRALQAFETAVAQGIREVKP